MNVELSEAAAKDAVNFGLHAFVEGEGDKRVVIYESKADMGEMDNSEEESDSQESEMQNMKMMCEECSYQIKWMREDVSIMRDQLYKHMSNGHLPPITDAGIMEKALKVLGLGSSFEVKKPSVYVQY